jgi:hypothetical protein
VMLTWINAGCDVGPGLPKCQAPHPNVGFGSIRVLTAPKAPLPG